MLRRNLVLSGMSLVVLVLIMFANAPVHSAAAAAADDAMTARLTAVAGAGMYGTHTFRYLTVLSDEIGARVTGSPEAVRGRWSGAWRQ